MRPRTLSLIVLVAACSSGSEPPVTRSQGSGSGSGSVVAVVVDAAPADASTLKQHMLEHFANVSELQRAIARGHLDDAKKHARWLASHDEQLLDGWKPYVDEMRAAARAVADAADLPTAAALVSRLGLACSGCHVARSAIVTFAWAPAPDEDPALQVQMKRHQWAAARLWEGLVGPSDEMWSQGTSALAESKLDTFAAASGSKRGDVVALAGQVRTLAKRATKLTVREERGKLYGELLSTCAGCHQLVRPNPVPGP